MVRHRLGLWNYPRELHTAVAYWQSTSNLKKKDIIPLSDPFYLFYCSLNMDCLDAPFGVSLTEFSVSNLMTSFSCCAEQNSSATGFYFSSSSRQRRKLVIKQQHCKVPEAAPSQSHFSSYTISYHRTTQNATVDSMNSCTVLNPSRKRPVSLVHPCLVF